MYITNENSATRRIYTEEIVDEEGEPLLDEPVEFADTGTAQVPREVGEALIARYDCIREKED